MPPNMDLNSAHDPDGTAIPTGGDDGTMSVIAEFTLGQAEFALGTALAPATDVRIELDQYAPMEPPGVPYLWVTGGELEVLADVVGDSALINAIELIDQSEGSALYRIEWEATTESLLQELARANVTILEAHRDGTEWHFRLRFDDHDDLTKFHEYCSSHEINYHLKRIYSTVNQETGRIAFGLTHEQYDTLVLALERGYFLVPRQVTLQELGRELGITQQATSERIRRAIDTVLRTVFLGPFSGDMLDR